MSGLKVTRAKPSLAHPVPVELVPQMAEEAWRLSFYEAFRSVPHRDEDPELRGAANGQRQHLHMMLALFSMAVAKRAVAAGLYETEEQFFAHDVDMSAFSDPASAGVDEGDQGEEP